MCKLNPARYGRAEDVVTASLSSCTQQVLAVDVSELDTKLVTAMRRHKLFGLLGWSTRAYLAWLDFKFVLSVFMLLTQKVGISCYVSGCDAAGHRLKPQW